MPEARALPPAELCEDLHVAVARAAAKTADSMGSLQVAVRRFTVALQSDGATPEAVLIALKNVINLRTFHANPRNADGLNEEELRQLISKWSIEEYFSETA